MNPAPETDRRGLHPPLRLSRELMSYFPRPRRAGALMLDLGCGAMLHREAAERAGFTWVGLDYQASGAPLLGDAHALPFRGASFDFVLSIAVIEHLRYPLVAMREAHRVLAPGGRFLGTAAFLEPYHSRSCCHHTHLGLLGLLRDAGFRVEHLAASEEWSALLAQASMGMFPRLPARLARGVVWPLELAHRAWWRMLRLLRPSSRRPGRTAYASGAHAFVAVKAPE